DLKYSVEGHANSTYVSECGSTGKTLLDMYFGRTPESPNVFFFKAEYLCNSSNDTIVKFLTCELSVSNEDIYSDISIDSLEVLSELELVDATNGRFKAYHGTDSSYFSISFGGNICFTQLRCNYVRNCDYALGNTINPFV